MAISAGMKIGIASGFMARREKIEEQAKEDVEDFRDATKASIKQANATIRADRRIDEEEENAGLNVMQNQVLAPIFKDRKLDPELVRQIGRSYINAAKYQKADINEFSRGLKKSIVNKSIDFDKLQEQIEARKVRQKAEVEQSKEEPRNYLNVIAESFSPSAAKERRMQVIDQSMTPEQKEARDRKYSTKERRVTLDVTPDVKNTNSQQNAISKAVLTKLDLGDLDMRTEQITYNPDLSTELRAAGQIIDDIARAYEGQYTQEEVGVLSGQMREIISAEKGGIFKDKTGVDFLIKNRGAISKSISEFGAKPTVKALLEGRILGQEETEKPKDGKPVPVKEDKKTDTDYKLPEGATKIEGSSVERPDGKINTQFKLPDGKIVVIIEDGLGTYFGPAEE